MAMVPMITTNISNHYYYYHRASQLETSCKTCTSRACKSCSIHASFLQVFCKNLASCTENVRFLARTCKAITRKVRFLQDTCSSTENVRFLARSCTVLQDISSWVSLVIQHGDHSPTKIVVNLCLPRALTT